MNKGMTVKRQFHVRKGLKGKKAVAGGIAATPPTEGVPRVSRLMALAIRFDQLIRDGAVKDQAELARLGRVSRARLTQIMNLMNLRPRIQEAILDLPNNESGRELFSERKLRPIAATLNWRRQLSLWQKLLSSSPLDS